MASGRNRGEWRPAPELPIARVAVDVPLAHLDRPFDYRVPTQFDAAAQPGVRVRVRFAGRLVDGYLLERAAESAHDGALAWLDRVVSPEPVLTPEVARLCRAVADRYAGVLADVVRLAVPPRHARVEAEPVPDAGAVAEADAEVEAACHAEAEPVADAGTGIRAEAGVQVAAAPGPRTADGTEAGAVGVTGAVAGTGTRTSPAADGRLEVRAPAGGGEGTEPGPDPPRPAAWGRYAHGPALLDALAAGRVAHAVWQALPGESWPARLAEAAAATVGAGRGALLVVPDQRDVQQLLAACAERVGPDRVVALTAELGPAERYRRWLAVRRGRVPVVVGTRSAAFAPVARLGLLAVWDDGDDLHAEPRAPYPHVRDVLVARAHQVGAALLVGGYGRTAEAQLLVESGWAREVVADRAVVRAAMPRATALGETEGQLHRDPDARAARLPAVAFDAARAALAAGRPVLVQSPRAGYLPWLACGACRETARCRHCAGPLGIPGGTAPAGGDSTAPRPPQCRWCGRAEGAFRCPACGSHRLRAGTVGAGRTAEELGRAFPGRRIRRSGGGAPVLSEVPAAADLVVATPGAEPRAAGGYGAALLLDGWALLSRPDLRVGEETLRRWLAAAALVVPHGEGGRVVVMAESADPTVQALVRWDPAGYAAAELAGRGEVGFPPAVRMAAVEGSAAAVADVVGALTGVEVLGPVELEVPPGSAPDDPAAEPRERALLRVPRADGRSLAAALHAAQAARTARKAPDPVRIRLDPIAIG